ncbi:serine hydrolase domain-containing protein [Sphingomonas sp. HF-S3]|uniref:Serine hydrolase domain-containing protein n=1 Tax=Sphingomonas rustica TaxID=3103142 RepID=A0ABV0BE99_9SPHN
MGKFGKAAFAAVLAAMVATSGAMTGGVRAQAPAQAPAAAAPATPPTARVGAAPLTKADVDAWLDGYLPYALQRGDAAGAVVVVVKDGKVLTQRGFGYADVASRKPVDPERTLFRQASISKTITWTAVMQLVEQGKIDLDRDVNAYLDFTIPARGGKPITMRNLMTHSAGFEEAQRGLNSYDPAGMPPLGAVLKRWTPTRIFDPGTTPAYSNYGTALAGYIVERVSGMPFADYAERNIFARAGMAHSSFRQPLPPSLRPLMASGYLLGSGPAGKFEMNSLSPAGALSATGADMGRFLIAHLADGGPLLKPQTEALMQRRTLGIPGLNGMALGFYEQNINGRRVLSHAGDTLAFHSQLWMFPQERLGIYFSMNAAGSDKVSGAIRSDLLDGFADRYYPAEPRDGRVDAETARLHARMMIGTYNKSRRFETTFLKVLELAGQVKVTSDGEGGIRFTPSAGLGGQVRKWVEIEPFVWRDATGRMRLAAVVENGKVVRFGLDSSPFMVFEPVSAALSTAWLTPALLLSLAALLLTALAWPVAALVRRRYGATSPLSGTALRGHRFTRAFAALAVAVFLGWFMFLQQLLSGFDNLGGQLDWALILLQLATPIIFVGLLGLSLWNAWLVWHGKRGWLARLWSIVVPLCALVLLWVAIGFHLIGFGLNF